MHATHRLKFSAGVSYSSIFLGLSLSFLAILLNFCWLCKDKSVPFGKYCLNNRLVFSLEPLCQGVLDLVNIAYLDRELAKFLSKRLLGIASEGLLAQKVANRLIFQFAGELKEWIVPYNEVGLVHDRLDDIEQVLVAGHAVLFNHSARSMEVFSSFDRVGRHRIL